MAIDVNLLAFVIPAIIVNALLQTYVMSVSAEDRIVVIPLKRTAVKGSKQFSSTAVNRTSHAWNSATQNNLHGQFGQGYYIEVGIGTPSQNLNVLVDTGSANFAVACQPMPEIDSYFHTLNSSTYVDLGETIDIEYTEGRWSGSLGSDLISIDGVDVNFKTDIACISDSYHFFLNNSLWHGIVGFGYSSLVQPPDSVPFMDCLIEGADIADVFSIQLCGLTAAGSDSDEVAGTLVFGGIDDTLYTGDFQYAKIINEGYYQIVITDIAVDGVSVGMDCMEYNYDKTIVDTGTTNLRLPTRVFETVIAEIKANTKIVVSDDFWYNSEMTCWPGSSLPWESFPTLQITLLADNQSNSEQFTLVVDPTLYLKQVTDTLLETETCYRSAIVASTEGTIFGAVFLEGFYTVYDRDNKRLGFARSSCADNSTDCVFMVLTPDKSNLLTVAYVMAGISTLCLLPLVFMLIQWIYIKYRPRKPLPDDNNTLLY